MGGRFGYDSVLFAAMRLLLVPFGAFFPFFGGTREARVSSANGVSRKPEIVSRSVPMKKEEENHQQITFCTSNLRQENAPKNIETAKNRRSLFCARSFYE